jgi:hypothetical protein
MGGSLLKFRHWYTVKRDYYNEISAKIWETLILGKKIFYWVKVEKCNMPKFSYDFN